MSKKSFILPIVAAMILAGCTLGKTTKKKKKSSSSSQISQSSGASSSQSGSSSAQGSSSASSAQGSSSGQGSSGSGSVTPVSDWTSEELTLISNAFGSVTIPYLGGLDVDSTKEWQEYEMPYIWGKNHTKDEIDAYESVLAATSGWKLTEDDEGNYYAYTVDNGELWIWFIEDDEAKGEYYFGGCYTEDEGGGEETGEPSAAVTAVIQDIVKAVFEQSTAEIDKDYYFDSTDNACYTTVSFEGDESALRTAVEQVVADITSIVTLTKNIAEYTDENLGNGYEAYLQNAAGTVEVCAYSYIYEGFLVVTILVYDVEGGTDPVDPVDPVDPTGETITISKEDIASNVAEGSTYPTASYTFTTDGVTFNATAGVGVAASQKSGGNYFYEQDLIQVRTHKDATEAKPGGEITNTTAISANTVTIRWFATYATEASEYHPVVKVGDSIGAVSTNVPCNEGTSLTGVDTGSKQNMNGTDREVYSYTTTYTITGHSYIMIASPNSATYIKDIVIS